MGLGPVRIEEEERQARKEVDHHRRLPDSHVAALLSDFMQSGSAADAFTPFSPQNEKTSQKTCDANMSLVIMMERVREHRKRLKVEEPEYYKLMYPSGSDGDHSD